MNITTQRKPISNFLIASRNVVSVQKELFHLGDSRHELYLIIWESEATRNPLVLFFFLSPLSLPVFLLKSMEHLSSVALTSH